MKPTLSSSIRILTFAAAMGCSLQLRAAEPIQVQWNRLCTATANNHLTITTADGSTVEGLCMSINVDEIAIRTDDHGVIKVARTTLAKIKMKSARQQHPLKSLGKGMRTGLHDSTGMLLSPYAPAGLVAVPAILAWGAVSAPFCALGELVNKLEGDQEIKLI